MKAVSLWQPWASAIPLGLKQIETRGWSTNYRGPLVIHAAKRWGADQRQFTRECAAIDPSLDIDLPFGAIIAVCELTSVVQSEHLRLCISETERRYGVYDDNRYGWMLANIKPIIPVPFKGGQGFFNVPDGMVVPL